MRSAVMVRYGEIFLKSEPVMRHYVGVLTGNIKRALDSVDICHEIAVSRGRIFVYGDDTGAISDIVSSILGVVSTSTVICTEQERETIEKTAAEVASRSLSPGMSFAVRAKRSNVKGFTSQELAASTGSRIYESVGGLTVDLEDPDYEIFVEARSEGGFVYEERRQGPGGLPLGTQGKVLCLISAGIDSPVASWLAMRRGCVPGFVYFDGGDYFGPDTRRAVLENLAAISRWAPGYSLDAVFFDIVPFYERLEKKCSVRNRCLVCKRFMLKLAGCYASSGGYLGLVTGNSIGQVASQTLANMGTVAAAAPGGISLIEPLITYDKEETVSVARRIGTFRECAGDLECRMVPAHPSTAASPEKVLEDERKVVTGGLVEECLGRRTLYRIKNGEVEGPKLP